MNWTIYATNCHKPLGWPKHGVSVRVLVAAVNGPTTGGLQRRPQSPTILKRMVIVVIVFSYLTGLGSYGVERGPFYASGVRRNVFVC